MLTTDEKRVAVLVTAGFGCHRVDEGWLIAAPAAAVVGGNRGVEAGGAW